MNRNYRHFMSKLLATGQTILSQVAKLLGTFSSNFIAIPCSKLYYRYLGRCKTKSLVISKENFNKTAAISKEAIQVISW